MGYPQIQLYPVIHHLPISRWLGRGFVKTDTPRDHDMFWFVSYIYMNHIYPIKYIKWTIEIPWNPPGYGSFLIFLPAASFPVTSGCEVQIFCAGAQLCGQQGQAGDVFLAKNHQIPWQESWQEKSQPCQALELWWIAICHRFGLIHNTCTCIIYYYMKPM